MNEHKKTCFEKLDTKWNYYKLYPTVKIRRNKKKYANNFVFVMNYRKKESHCEVHENWEWTTGKMHSQKNTDRVHTEN